MRNLWTKPGSVAPTRAAAKEKVAENLWAGIVLAERSPQGGQASPPFSLPEFHRFLSIWVRSVPGQALPFRVPGAAREANGWGLAGRWQLHL